MSTNKNYLSRKKCLVLKSILLGFIVVFPRCIFANKDFVLPSQWTEQEIFVWTKLTNGEFADLSEFEKIKMSKKKYLNGEESLIISKEFLETLLFQKDYLSKVSRQGVRIQGAIFNQEINFENATINTPIIFKGCKFNDTVNLARANVQKFLSFEGSEFTSKSFVNLSRVRVARSLDLSKIESKKASLVGASIDGMLDMRGARVNDTLNMRRIHVSLSLLLRESNKKKPGRFNVVVLHDSKIGGDLVISNSIFESTLDLTSAQIHGELRLGSETRRPAQWGNKARLVLRNATVNSFQDGGQNLNSWPELDLIGFNYQNLGGLEQKVSESLLNRDANWFKAWLQKQPDFSPQPYQHLRQTLLNAGFQTKAKKIGYAAKNKERKKSFRSGEMFRWFSLTLQWIFIGYGYYLMRSLIWMLIFVIIGSFLLKKTKLKRINRYWYDRIFFSFDLLVPVIELDKRHNMQNFEGYSKYYFYFHKILGFLIASYVVAGLTGITK